MTFWWASQSKNYRVAIPQGTLWSCPVLRADGILTQRRDRAALKDMRRDEIVFHYADGFLRAVSRVTAPFVDAPRPVGYPKIREGDLDDGWLVRVQPLAVDLAVPFAELQPLVGAGVGKPFGTDGRPAQKYLSRLESHEAAAVLRALSASVFDELDLDSLRDVAEGAGLVRTDARVWGTSRREQAELRQRLLAGRRENQCWLCGRDLPAAFLVAAHIKPRYMLSDAERLHFDDVAVLMCTLGCDALFERGYLVVVNRTVQRGRPADNDSLLRAIAALEQRRVEYSSEDQKARFEEHALLHLGGVQ